MIRAMRTAATGMKAQQLNVDIIAHNLANVNTTGFKKSRIEFQDLFYYHAKVAGKPRASGEESPASLEIGYGTAPVATLRMFSQGEMIASGNALDLAIRGDGFFRVLLPQGGEAYTRDGSFKVSGEGRLMTTDGYTLDPDISFPGGTSHVTISDDGVVAVTIADDTTPQIIGQIELVRFVNPSGLQAIGQNLLVETPASGAPTFGTPGSDGMGSLGQGYLEVSNVDIVEEMIALIAAQRAYELNSKAIKASEEMMSMANNLAR
ncbi:MAG: flagellar basal-body rod protein FlgG [Candidatus Eisenbacteria sp.]|nr:flagellar basal-body rod protein FlgG [Candidatus Eisenbacteria bacterium]